MATRAVALDMAQLVTVAAAEVSNLKLGEHGLGISVIIAGVMARRRLTPVFIHQVEYIRHGCGVAVFPFCKVVGEVVSKGAKTSVVGPAENERSQEF